MNPSVDLASLVAKLPYGARIVEKKGWFWNILDLLVKIVTFGKNKKFLTDYVTTLGNRIAVPVGWREEVASPIRRLALLHHELTHVRQCAALGFGHVWLGFPLYSLLYLLIPVPIGFAYFRWRYEREAYLVGIKVCRRYSLSIAELSEAVENAIDQLSGPFYAWTWCLRLHVRRWFVLELAKGDDLVTPPLQPL